MPLQHEDGEAWADAETGMAEPAEAAKQELQTEAGCDSSDATKLDKDVGSTDILDLDLAQSIIQDCSVIVGIHPDQVSCRYLAGMKSHPRQDPKIGCCQALLCCFFSMSVVDTAPVRDYNDISMLLGLVCCQPCCQYCGLILHDLQSTRCLEPQLLPCKLCMLKFFSGMRRLQNQS